MKAAQKQALIKALKKNSIPYREFKIKAINELVLIIVFNFYYRDNNNWEIVKVKSHDQPAVEQVKVDTKQLLS